MNEDFIEKLAFLALGWLLGLLGPIIVESIKRRRENKMGRKAILSELNELGAMLSVAAYGVHILQGTLNRSFLKWFKTDLEKYATSEEFQTFISHACDLLSYTDDELKKLENIPLQDKKGTMLQHYPAPLLDTRISAIWSFDTSFQRNLLSIKQSLVLLDDLVDQSRKYFDLTFTKLDDLNRQSIRENHKQSCFIYAERAQKTVNLIRKLDKCNIVN